MKINLTLSIFLFLFLISCKKESSDPSMMELTNLKNYRIQKTKINDSIAKIYGENNYHSIEGKLNTKENKKNGWWKIRFKNKSVIYKIEYLIFDKEKLNQLKVYVDGNLIKSASKFYEAKFESNKFQIKIHFPKIDKKPYQENVEMTYYLADTIRKKINSQIKTKMSKRNDFYFTEIPLKNNENAIIGSVTKVVSKNIKQDSVQLSAETIYFKNNKE